MVGFPKPDDIWKSIIFGLIITVPAYFWGIRDFNKRIKGAVIYYKPKEVQRLYPLSPHDFLWGIAIAFLLISIIAIVFALGYEKLVRAEWVFLGFVLAAFFISLTGFLHITWREKKLGAPIFEDVMEQTPSPPSVAPICEMKGKDWKTNHGWIMWFNEAITGIMTMVSSLGVYTSISHSIVLGYMWSPQNSIVTNFGFGNNPILKTHIIPAAIFVLFAYATKCQYMRNAFLVVSASSLLQGFYYGFYQNVWVSVVAITLHFLLLGLADMLRRQDASSCRVPGIGFECGMFMTQVKADPGQKPAGANR